MRLRKERRAVRVLNVTPLIDVVFILLVFFMLATNFARFRLIGIETPQETRVVSTSEGAVVILLELDGDVRFDGEPAVFEDLPQLVAGVVAIDPERLFLVRPEPGVSLQEAIAAYDAAKEGGARGVSFSRSHTDGGG